MRNRLNITFNGKRTTARFPLYLWRLALIASSKSDECLCTYLRTRAAECEGDAFYSDHSPSQAVQEWLADLIEEELTLVGFNPDSSRAQGLPKPPKVHAAEARRTSDE